MIADRDLHEAMASLEKIKPTGQPEADKRMVDYLTSLTKGANPKIPEVMALAQLQAFQKAMSQKPTAAPPQGTIRDKAVQSAGIMALQGAQQNQQNPNVIPEGIPQPQMQAQAPANGEMPTEATQQAVMAARGGLMQAKVDPRMFEFSDGGIIAFSGKGRSDVPEDDTVYDPITGVPISGSSTREGEDMTLREALGLGNVENRRALEKAEREARDAKKPKEKAPPSAPPPEVVEAPPPPPSGSPSAGGQRPAAGPRPAGSTGIAQALPPELEAMRPRDNPDYKRLLEQSQGVADAYGKTVETQRTKAERPLLDSARDLQETRKQLGIGDYANTLEKNRAEEKQEYEAAKKKREDKELNAMLNAMFKPGFKRGDISLARQEKLKEFEEADKTFTAAQRQSLAEISKYKESLAMGDLKEASDAKKEAEKGLITMAGKLAELKLGTFEQAIAYLKHGDNKSMEFNKAVLGFRTHQQDMAQRYSAQKDQAKMRHEDRLEALKLRSRELDIKAANYLTQAQKPEYTKLANEKSMQQILYTTAMKNEDGPKADKAYTRMMEIEDRQAMLLAPITAMQASGIASAPGAAPPTKGGKTIDFNTGKETR
jgi:hypothetical protein